MFTDRNLVSDDECRGWKLEDEMVSERKEETKKRGRHVWTFGAALSMSDSAMLLH